MEEKKEGVADCLTGKKNNYVYRYIWIHHCIVGFKIVLFCSYNIVHNGLFSPPFFKYPTQTASKE